METRLTPMRPRFVKGNSVAARPSSDVSKWRIVSTSRLRFGMDAGWRALHQTPIEGHGPGIPEPSEIDRAVPRCLFRSRSPRNLFVPSFRLIQSDGLGADAPSSYSRARRGAGHRVDPIF